MNAEQFLTDRAARMPHTLGVVPDILGNPDRRHEPDGVCAPEPVIPKLGIAKPTHPPMLLPSDPAARKDLPICSGVLDYFPLAIAEVARVSKAGNEQHNPGQPLHWARGKSTDHADCIPRHLIDRGRFDTDGMRHTAKLAWRALALLETELEAERDAGKMKAAPQSGGTRCEA